MEINSIAAILVFPSGLMLLGLGLAYEWLDRKLMARFQNRIGPRWFQPLADTIKLMAKEEIIPEGVNKFLFVGLPILALSGALTSALYTPMFGLKPAFSFEGDLIVALYLLSLMTLSMGIAGSNTLDRFSIIGATRALTQLFSYEAPFMLALLGPAIVAGSWQISEINAYAQTHTWFMLTQPIGFIIAIIGLLGKLEMPPFDAPEAETEIVAGAMTEYSGRGLALFHLGQVVEMVIGITLVAAFYLGGIGNPMLFFVKTLIVLLVVATLQSFLARLRIDQTVGLWWQYGTLIALLQLVITFIAQRVIL
ncbi:MAG: NADH-quinone oxidoreductase subunit H [Anaerolineales bacterium]|nr:NADH-quinone oxidoreductase subunit H [Anaerolineales bacterium]